MLQPAPGITLYKQVRDEIESRIKTREWKPGDQIPNEETLARRWGVSRGTIRQAIQQLCTEGVLLRQQGRGTFIAQPRTIPFLPSIFYRLTEDEESPRFRVVSHELASAPSWVAEQLNQDPDTQVFTLHRLLLKGENAVSIKTLYFNPDAAQECLTGEVLELPMMKIINEHLRSSVCTVDVTIEIITLDMDEIQILGEEPGSPGMKVINRYVAPDNTPLVISETIMPAGLCRYQFTVPITPSG